MKDHPLHLEPSFFEFLRDLKDNNDRDWFTDHKKRYESEVKKPLQGFIASLAGPLASVSSELVCDPKKSMFRIYRDVRFSKNKDPYKTHAAAQFRHVAGKDVHAPGAYLHLAPGEVFCGAGIWQPDSATLRAIRDRIVEKPAEWKKVVGDKQLKTTWEFAGSSLKRGPKGYDLEHPLIEDIKRKDFIVTAPLTEEDVCTPGFGERLVETLRKSEPLMRFLTKACGVSY